jgi:hypothetical protein
MAAAAAPQKAAPRKAPARKAGTRRAAPRKSRTATPVAAGARGHLIPLAVGRTAVAVRGLPDCGLVTQLTRRRAWIPVIGLLLAGIVALNVATLSFSATAGKIEADIQTLEQENSVLRSRVARRLSNERVQGAAAGIGLVSVGPDEIGYVEAGGQAVSAAARRLAAAAPPGSG